MVVGGIDAPENTLYYIIRVQTKNEQDATIREFGQIISDSIHFFFVKLK